MLPSDSRPPAWLPVRALQVLCPLEHQRQNHGHHSPLPPRPALSSPRAPKNCSSRGPCLLRPRLTSSGIWWLNFGAFQSSGHHPRPRRSLPRLPHQWPANPQWEFLLRPPVFPGWSLLLFHRPMGSLTLRTGLKGSWQRMEVCSWLLQRRWAPLVQIHRRSWSDHHHSTGPADPSQGYSLSGTRAALRKRGSGRHNLRQDACGLNLHSLPCLCKPGVAHPPSYPSPPCLFLKGSPSSSPSASALAPLEEGSWWEGVAVSHPPPRPQGHSGGRGAECVFLLFHVWNHVYCNPESKHFAK